MADSIPLKVTNPRVSHTTYSRKLLFSEFGNPKVTVHKAKGHSIQMWGNYSREETIQGRKLYEEIRYSNKCT